MFSCVSSYIVSLAPFCRLLYGYVGNLLPGIYAGCNVCVMLLPINYNCAFRDYWSSQFCCFSLLRFAAICCKNHEDTAMGIDFFIYYKIATPKSLLQRGALGSRLPLVLGLPVSFTKLHPAACCVSNLRQKQQDNQICGVGYTTTAKMVGSFRKLLKGILLVNV